MGCHSGRGGRELPFLLTHAGVKQRERRFVPGVQKPVLVTVGGLEGQARRGHRFEEAVAGGTDCVDIQGGVHRVVLQPALLDGSHRCVVVPDDAGIGGSGIDPLRVGLLVRVCRQLVLNRPVVAVHAQGPRPVHLGDLDHTNERQQQPPGVHSDHTRSPTELFSANDSPRRGSVQASDTERRPRSRRVNMRRVRSSSSIQTLTGCDGRTANCALGWTPFAGGVSR
jgi:hypothetical protein